MTLIKGAFNNHILTFLLTIRTPPPPAPLDNIHIRILACHIIDHNVAISWDKSSDAISNDYGKPRVCNYVRYPHVILWSSIMEALAKWLMHH